MDNYKHVFRDLRYEVWKVGFLNAFLNAALIFFISNIILTIIKERYIYSIVPAAIVFLWSLISKLRQYTLKRIEEGNPEVADILRTANDNKDKDELMVHALFLDLMQKMETVTAGIFINPRTMLLKLGTIAVLAFIPLLITNFTPFLIMDNPLAGLTVQGIMEGKPLAPITPIADEGQRDIYGNKDIITLGNEKLDITAVTGPGSIDFTKKTDASGNQFRSNDYPIDVQAEQTTAGTGGIASDSELINDYSCKTKKTC